MQGTVLNFDSDTNKGAISGHDGNRYYFVRMDWTSDKEPKEGQTVDFEPEDKNAKEIMVVKSGTSQSQQKSKGTAGLLALFLGGIGAHRFYLGQTSFGIMYLVFFWTFIPALIALIEAIRYFTMSDDEFADKYL